jgi:hypothetical protein
MQTSMLQKNMQKYLHANKEMFCVFGLRINYILLLSFLRMHIICFELSIGFKIEKEEL